MQLLLTRACARRGVLIPSCLAALLLATACADDEVRSPTDQLGPLIFVEAAADGQRIESLTPTGARAASLPTAHKLIVSPRWSPSGAMIAYVGFESDAVRDLWIVEVEDGRPSEPRSVLRWETAEQPPLLHWLPDESGLVWAEPTDTEAVLRRLDLSSGVDSWSYDVQMFELDVAVDGRIAGSRTMGEQSSTIAIYDADYQLTAESDPDVGAHPRWSPDASEVAFVLSEPPGVAILDPSSGAWERLTEGDDRYLRWAADGSRLSFVRDGQLIVRERASGAETIVLEASASAHEWSRDGSRIAMPGLERTTWLLATSDWTVRTVEDARASVPNLDWGPE